MAYTRGAASSVGPGRRSGGVGAHVANRGDTLSQEVAQVERQVFAGAAARQEQQVDMAVDQAGDELLTLGVDDPRNAGTGHSPTEPAQRIRSPRTRVTALRTGARPVPSHRVAPTIATEGTGGRGSRGAGRRSAAGAKASVR